MTTNPKAGQPDFRPDAEMFVCMDPTGCYHVSWNEPDHLGRMALLGATEEARYVRADHFADAGDMVATDEMVERVARALAAERYEDRSAFDSLREGTSEVFMTKDDFRHLARAALTGGDYGLDAALVKP